MSFKAGSAAQRQHFISQLLYDLRDADDSDRAKRNDQTDRVFASKTHGPALRYIDSPVTRLENVVMEAMDGRGDFFEMAQLRLPQRLELILEAAQHMNQYAGTGNTLPPYFGALETLCVLVRYALPHAELTDSDRTTLEHQLCTSHHVIDQQLRRRIDQPDDLYPRISYNSFLLTNVSPQMALHAASLNAYRKDFQDYAMINMRALEKINAEQGPKALMMALETPLRPIWFEATKIRHESAAMDVLMDVHDNLAKCAENLDRGSWFYTNLTTAVEMPEDNAFTQKVWNKITQLYKDCIDEGHHKMASGILENVLNHVSDDKALSAAGLEKNKKIEAIIDHCRAYAEEHKRAVAVEPLRPPLIMSTMPASRQHLWPTTVIPRSSIFLSLQPSGIQ